MKTRILKTFAAIMTAVILSACGQESTKQKAERLLGQARTQYADKHYDEALATIDSLRKSCPKEFEARKAALFLRQDIELERAKRNVEEADKAVTAATREYEEMEKAVGLLKQNGNITAADLAALTRKKLGLDSIQAVFDAECAKIRYIRMKMDQYKADRENTGGHKR